MNILSDIGLLVPQTHRPNESLILDRPSSKIRSHKRRLGDHSLPALLRSLLSSLHNLEHLLLTNALNLRQRHRELRSLLRSLVLDRTDLTPSHWSLVTDQADSWAEACWTVRQGAADLTFFSSCCLDRLLHLDLLLVSLLLVQLGSSDHAGSVHLLDCLVAFTCLRLRVRSSWSSRFPCCFWQRSMYLEQC